MLKNDEKSTRTLFELRNTFEEGSEAVPGVIWAARAGIVAPKTASLAAKTANLAAKTAQLGVPKPSLRVPGMTRSFQKRAESAREQSKAKFRRFFGRLDHFWRPFSASLASFWNAVLVAVALLAASQRRCRNF